MHVAFVPTPTQQFVPRVSALYILCGDSGINLIYFIASHPQHINNFQRVLITHKVTNDRFSNFLPYTWHTLFHREPLFFDLESDAALFEGDEGPLFDQDVQVCVSKGTNQVSLQSMPVSAALERQPWG
jgi:hypothetical protein